MNDNYAEYFMYLDMLQESGETNMFGAPSYLQINFGLDKRTSYQVTQDWMQSKERERDNA